MIDKIVENKFKIAECWNRDENFIEILSSEELFQIVMLFLSDKELSEVIKRNADKILNRCTLDFDMFNYFTILSMKINGINKEACEESLNRTVREIFMKESIIFLMKQYKKMKERGVIRSEQLFEEILNELREMPTDKSSKILFDLYIFPDFKLMLNKSHRTIATIIEAYQLYDPTIISSQIFNGSTIIGKLLKGKNEQIASKYLRGLLEEKQISTRNIKMIGGGGSSLVFRINDLVIKLGESRNNRRIFINHRILASLVRKLELDENEEELFYVEIMKYALVGDVTPEERDELRQDLYEQGLIWDDDKLANCGVLVDGDDNISTLPVDYVEVMADIDNPYRREEFMKRKRKVVVIDNDHITYNPLKSCR